MDTLCDGVTQKHTLPYSVFIEELEVRRPQLVEDWIATNNFKSKEVPLHAIYEACSEIEIAREQLPRLPEEEVDFRSQLDNKALDIFDRKKKELNQAANGENSKQNVGNVLEELRQELSRNKSSQQGLEKAEVTEIYLQKVQEYYLRLGSYRCALAKGEAAEKPFKMLLHDAELNAICLSGGGIRSASFSLGVLMELAKESSKGKDDKLQPEKAPGLVGELDYVSTVSGGGYTGSWLTAWTSRHPNGFAGVVRDLAKGSCRSTDPEVDQVRHLRDYTSYLTPRMGLLSLDSWTLAAIFLRNLILNWTILLPVFALALLVPVFNLYLVTLVAKSTNFIFLGIGMAGRVRVPVFIYIFPTFLLLLALAGAILGLIYITLHLPTGTGEPGKRAEKKRDKTISDQAKEAWNNFWLGAWVPLLISAWCISGYWLARYTARGEFWIYDLTHHLWWFAVIALIPECALVAGRIVVAGKSSWKNLGLLGIVALANSTFVAWLLWLLATKLGPVLVKGGDDYTLFTSVAVPLVWIAFMLGVVVMNGMSSQIESEEGREWWSRSGAVMLIGTATWVVAHALVLYCGDIANAVAEAVKKIFPAATMVGTTTISMIAVVLGAAASLLGFSTATSSGHTEIDTGKLKSVWKFLSKRELLIPALGVLFFLVLGIALANVNEFFVSRIAEWFSSKEFAGPGVAISIVSTLAIAAAALFALAMASNWVVNINTFSLHGMYRMRLIRSYLGASNLTRRPNPFTNFDPADNFAMQDAPHQKGAPLHIINMALNLVSSSKLAWQQRKAESFTVSALHSGSYRVGYQPTARYGGERGIDLGTAMAISGAAASPNMGYHSSPVLTLAMTLFNARLGWWLPNPGKAGKGVWQKNSPRLSMIPLLNECFGNTTDTQEWIYLSDGGHFENLGLYEMVMRRCKHIIVVDGSADPEFKMDDLGSAVRKIQIDLGIPIEFVTAFAIGKGKAPANRHCAVAKIKYGCVDKIGPNKYEHEAAPGWLVYIKTSMNGNEPADVLQYAATHKDFPHEPTANQFFNEAQFQSYVRLGSDIVREIVEPTSGSRSLTIEHFVKAARTHATVHAAAVHKTWVPSMIRSFSEVLAKWKEP